MAQEGFVGIEQRIPISVDLPHGFGIIASPGQERRQHIEGIDPELWFVDNMVDDAVGIAGRFRQCPMEKAFFGLQEKWLSGLLTCADQGLPDGAGIGGGEGGADRGAAAHLILPVGGFVGKQNSGFVFFGFQKSLGQNALFPVVSLHGQGGAFYFLCHGLISVGKSVCFLVYSSLSYHREGIGVHTDFSYFQSGYGGR